MKKNKKKTLAQKKKNNPNKPKGKSKYALKVEARKKLARKLGYTDMPLPFLRLQDD